MSPTLTPDEVLRQLETVVDQLHDAARRLQQVIDLRTDEGEK